MHFSIGLDLKGFVLIKLQVYVWFLKPNLQKFNEIWFVTKMISLSWNYKVTGKMKGRDNVHVHSDENPRIAYSV